MKTEIEVIITTKQNKGENDWKYKFMKSHIKTQAKGVKGTTTKSWFVLVLHLIGWKDGTESFWPISEQTEGNQN